MIVPGIVAAAATVAGWIFAQALFLGLVPRRLRFRANGLLYGAAFAAYLVWQWSTLPLNWLNGALVHILLFCTFMEFYYYIDRPVTLRLLREADQNPGKILDVLAMEGSYNLETMLCRRLETLVAGGWLCSRGGRFHLTARGKMFAALFEKGTRLFGVRR